MKIFSFPRLVPLTSILATTISLLAFPVRASAGETITSQTRASSQLILPSPILAKIDKNHAYAYALKVRYFISQEEARRDIYNAFTENLATFANAMKPLIGSNEPGHRALLESYKKASAEMAEDYRTDYLKYCEKYAKDAKKFYPACKQWFSKPADRIRFHRWTGQLSRGVDLVNEAFAYEAFAYKVLSKEDIDRARKYNNEAARLVTKAEPMIDEALEGLRELNR